MSARCKDLSVIVVNVGHGAVRHFPDFPAGKDQAMKPTVLFVCYGNSCRSIMAEAIARHLLGVKMRALSAGIHPLGKVSPDTYRALKEIGVPVRGLHSKGMAAVDFTRVDWVVNLTSRSLTALLPRSFAGRVINHPIPDPFARGPAVYRASRNMIRDWIENDLPQLLDSWPAPSKRAD